MSRLCKRILAVLAVFLVVPVATAGLATAAPKWVRVTVPAADPEFGQVIAWNSDFASDSSDVQYGLSAASMTESVTGTSFAGKGKLGTIHEVTLTGLQPDTKYTYRVGGASGGWSSNHTFRTAPKPGCGPYTFIAAGDHRSDDTAGPSPKWKSILGEMVATGARFILETGDLVHDGDDVNQWWNHMEMGAVHMGEIALMPSFGNHDSDNVTGAAAAFNQLFALPSNDKTSSEDFYSFTYGNAIFCALSTATHSDAAGLQKQADWLDETLTKNADKAWKFVYFHHPIYTSFIDLKFAELNHPPNEKGQNPIFVPVFDKHHVDIVFSGHNHFYERFSPMKGGNEVATAAAGTLYVTTGGAGAFTYDTIDIAGFKIEPMAVICGAGVMGLSGKAKGSQICSGKHHYVEVKIDGGKLTAIARATEEQNLSSSPKNVVVIDTFSITKTVPTAECGIKPGEDAGSTSPDASSSDTSAVDVAVDTGAAKDSQPDVPADPDTMEPDTTTPDEDVDVATPPDTGKGSKDSGTGGILQPQADTGGGTAASPAPSTSSGCAAGGQGASGGVALVGMLAACAVMVARRRRKVG